VAFFKTIKTAARVLKPLPQVIAVAVAVAVAAAAVVAAAVAVVVAVAVAIASSLKLSLAPVGPLPLHSIQPGRLIN